MMVRTPPLPPAIDVEERRISHVILTVEEYQIFEIVASVKNNEAFSLDKPAVIAYIFKDGKGRNLDDLYASHHYSPIIGANYRYILAKDIGKSVALDHIVAPENAATLHVIALIWQLRSPNFIDIKFDVRRTAPTTELARRVFSKNEAIGSRVVATMLDLASEVVSANVLMDTFDIAWRRNDFQLAWKIGRRLHAAGPEKAIRRRYLELSKKIDQLTEMSAGQLPTSQISHLRKSGNKELFSGVLRLISSRKAHMSEADLIEEDHLPPAADINTDFLTPVECVPDVDKPLLWIESKILDHVWWIQAGLARPFVERASILLLQDYAYTLMVQRTHASNYALIHAGPGVRGYELGALGVGLAKMLKIPFLFEFDSSKFSYNGDTSGTFPETRLHKALSLCAKADLVITHRERDNSILEDNHINPNKIRFVSPSNPISASQELAEVYRSF